MSCDCNTLVVGEAGVQGPQGLAGINGTNGTNGLNAFTTTSASFVQPAVNSNISFSVVENRWIAIGQTIYISDAGFYRVTALGSNPYTPVTATLLKTDGVVNPSSVNSGSKVSPSSVATLTSSLPSLQVTGNSLLDGAVTINDSGASVDFRVETDSQTHALYAKGSTNAIGICNSAPVATLDVAGTFKASQAAEFVLGATVNSSQANADFIVKSQGATDTLYVDASASMVGIGTSGPVKLLDVNGSAQAVSLLVNPGGLSDASSFKVLGAFSGVPLNVDSTNNRVGIKTTSPSVELDVVGAAKISGNATVGSNVLKVNTSNSRVGINKETPTVALDVVGATVVTGNVTVGSNVLKVNSTGTFVGINKETPTVALDVVGALTVSGATNLISTLDVTGATTLDSTLDVAGNLSVATNVLKVNTATGHIGINKTTPTVDLDVVGEATVTGATILGSTLAVAGDLSVATNVLKVNATGPFVGINKTTPTVALDVVGATVVTGNVTVGTNVLKVNSTGTFVGINKETPIVALDVVGDTNISSTLDVTGATDLGSTLTVAGDLSVDTDVLKVDVSGPFVGINNATPTVDLDVIGSIKATDYRVSTGSGAAKLTKFLYGSGSATFALLANDADYFDIIAITGAVLGDFVQVSYSTIPGATPNLLTLFGYVSAADTVTVVVSNGTSTAVANQTYAVNVLVTGAAAS